MKNSSEKDPTCVASKKRFPNRWSIRQLLYSSPLLNRRRNQGNVSTPKSSRSHDNDNRLGQSSRDLECGLSHPVQIHHAVSRISIFAGSNISTDGPTFECPLCFAELRADEIFEVASCGHRACLHCLKQYLRVEISESRVIITCHECPEPIHPNEIKLILDDPIMMDKYEDFMVRRVLAVDADTRYCPVPDCGFAVIATECASCPKLKCERPGCDSFFCYHCKAEWHPNQTCDAARSQRSPNIRSSSLAYSTDSQYKEDIKPCPRCEVLIVKMDDGSCNHMMCAVCGAEFCWLCMKEISDLHYLSPSGCTFWGKKPWSRKKKILWQLGTLVGAPIGIALVAGITVPAMVIGIPVWIGKKMYTRYQNANKHKRNAAIIGGVLASVLISPILAGLAVGIGVPILLFYVYGVVPVSLCRSGGCGGSSTTEDNDTIKCIRVDRNSLDAVSVSMKVPNPSIGEASSSLASDSNILRELDRDSSSTVALAGSVAGHRLEVQADLTSIQRYSITSLSAESCNNSFDEAEASMAALAGSISNYKANGSDSRSKNTNEERVHFEDNGTYKASQAEKVSIESSCSYRPKAENAPRLDRFHDMVGNDSISIDMTPTQERPARKFISQTAFLRSQFFYSSVNEQKPTTKSIEENTIIESSNETLDNRSCSGSLSSTNFTFINNTTKL